jgi:DNA-binding transcriptional regulator YdaS (Cro superfamily)
MKLAQYLDSTRTKRSAFAASISVSPAYVSGLCAGEYWPSRAVMARIVAATGGAVRPDDFLDLDPHPDPALSPPDAAGAEGTPSPVSSPAAVPSPAEAGSARSPSEASP